MLDPRSRKRPPLTRRERRIGEVDGQPYVAYEYVRGRNLDEHPRPAQWQDVLRIALGVGRALSAAHSRGVLHRDVKPANILESHEGEIKLVDFGLAKLEREGDSAGPPSSIESPLETELAPPSRKTAPGVLAGTPLYIAPELWLGEQATPASDVFALGLVLYELATGAIPHADLGPLEIARRVVASDLPSIPSLRPDFPVALLGRGDTRSVACRSRSPSSTGSRSARARAPASAQCAGTRSATSDSSCSGCPPPNSLV